MLTPRPKLFLTGILFTSLCVFLHTGCRTQSEGKEEVQPEPLQSQVQDKTAPVLQKVVGDLTRDHPDNRFEVCTLLEGDLKDFARVKQEIERVKGQEISEGFILTPVIPSLQYFAYLGSEKILLSEIGSTRKIRLPVGEQGNPSLDYIMEQIDEKCGAKHDRP